jgi:hypothetical protein
MRNIEILCLGVQFIANKYNLNCNLNYQEKQNFQIYGLNPSILKDVDELCQNVRLKPNNIIVDGKCVIIQLQNIWITKFSKKTYIGKKIWSNLIENKLTLCK